MSESKSKWSCILSPSVSPQLVLFLTTKTFPSGPSPPVTEYIFKEEIKLPAGANSVNEYIAILISCPLEA